MKQRQKVWLTKQLRERKRLRLNAPQHNRDENQLDEAIETILSIAKALKIKLA